MMREELMEQEITELAEILHNFEMDITTIKANLKSFLLAHHYMQLADDQSLPKTITNEQMAEAFGGYDFSTEDMRTVCIKEQRNMVGKGWRKVILEK